MCPDRPSRTAAPPSVRPGASGSPGRQPFHDSAAGLAARSQDQYRLFPIHGSILSVACHASRITDGEWTAYGGESRIRARTSSGAGRARPAPRSGPRGVTARARVTIGSRMSTPQSESTAVILARGVVKRYGTTVALAGLDAEIGPGITGLLGSNGAGKTTFISLALGLRSRDGGELTVLGHDPRRRASSCARGSVMPEHHDLPAELAAADFVRHLAEMHLLPRRAAVQRANDTLWLVGLGEERFRPVGTMSTGQRQRWLASAIARPRARAARRADRRARPHAAHGDACPHPAHRDRVRDAHPRVVTPPRGGRADLRRRRDRGGRRGRPRRDAREPAARPGGLARRSGRAGRRAGVDPGGSRPRRDRRRRPAPPRSRRRSPRCGPRRGRRPRSRPAAARAARTDARGRVPREET